MGDQSISPIVLERHLRCGVERAFEVYSRRIGDWWDPRYTANAETLQSVMIEPFLGGRVYATHLDLGRHDWGEVLVWEPPTRLVHSFTLAQDPQHPSQVAVQVIADGDGSIVRLEHGGWTEGNVSVRHKFGDWPVMLDRLVAIAEQPD